MNKNMLWALIFGAVAGAASVGQAQDFGPRELFSADGWELGVFGAQSTYKEGAVDVQDHLTSVGVSAGYTQHTDGDSWWRADYRGAYAGNGKYKSRTDGLKDGEKDYLNEARFVLGSDWPLLAGSVVASPYVGLGYRSYFNDGQGITTGGSAGYRRWNQTVYVPLGVDVRADVGVPVKLNVEYGSMVRGWQKSYLSDAGPSYHDIKNTQTEGQNVKASLGVVMRGWETGVYGDFWHVADSDVSGGFYEPQNRTQEIGVYVKRRFGAFGL